MSKLHAFVHFGGKLLFRRENDFSSLEVFCYQARRNFARHDGNNKSRRSGFVLCYLPSPHGCGNTSLKS